MIKLKNILLEDSRKSRFSGREAIKGAKDLLAWMKDPLSAQGADPTGKLSGSAKRLVTKGKQDGDERDDATIVAGGLQNPSVADIQASQNEVGKEQSLKNVMTGENGMSFDGIDYGDVNWLIAAMKPGAKITFSNALLGAETEDGMVVLDGHHRWSQAFMINPTAKVNVEVAKSNLSADDTLQAVHLAILAKTGASKTKGAKGGNLFAANESDVEGYLNAPKRKVDPKTGEDSDTGIAPYIYAVMKTKNITDPVEGKKAAIAYAMDAIKKCADTVVTGAPKRDSMPQADNELNAIDAKGAFDALGSGEVNFSPPYRKESIQNKKSILTKNTMKQKSKISIAEQKETLKMKRTARIISEAEYQKRLRLIEDDNVLGTDKAIPLSAFTANQKGTETAITQGYQDKNAEDDKVTSKKDTPFKVSELTPGQKDMVPSKAVGMAIGNLLKGKVDGQNLGSIISEDNVIMDGHHRWAGVYLCDPNASIKATQIMLPGAALISALNLVTVGKLGVTAGNKGEGNITNFKADTIGKILDVGLAKGLEGKFPLTAEEVKKGLSKMPNAGGDAEKGKQEMMKNADAIGKTSVMSGAPDRVEMPVIDEKQVAIVAKLLNLGRFDIKSPYSKATKAAMPALKDHILRDLESVLQESIVTWKKNRRK